MDQEVFDWIKTKLGADKTGPAEEFDLSELTPQDWETIVSGCNDGRDWCNLLKLKPEFAGRCPWDKLCADGWSYLLRFRPQFADKCDWEKLKDLDSELWDELLDAQPQFADKRPPAQIV